MPFKWSRVEQTIHQILLITSQRNIESMLEIRCIVYVYRRANGKKRKFRPIAKQPITQAENVHQVDECANCEERWFFLYLSLNDSNRIRWPDGKKCGRKGDNEMTIKMQKRRIVITSPTVFNLLVTYATHVPSILYCFVAATNRIGNFYCFVWIWMRTYISALCSPYKNRGVYTRADAL